MTWTLVVNKKQFLPNISCLSIKYRINQSLSLSTYKTKIMKRLMNGTTRSEATGFMQLSKDEFQLIMIFMTSPVDVMLFAATCKTVYTYVDVYVKRYWQQQLSYRVNANMRFCVQRQMYMDLKRISGPLWNNRCEICNLVSVVDFMYPMQIAVCRDCVDNHTTGSHNIPHAIQSILADQLANIPFISVSTTTLALRRYFVHDHEPSVQPESTLKFALKTRGFGSITDATDKLMECFEFCVTRCKEIVFQTYSVEQIDSAFLTSNIRTMVKTNKTLWNVLKKHNF